MKRFICLFVLLAVASGHAQGLGWDGWAVGRYWSRPSEDLSSVEALSYPWSSLAVYVDRSGEYHFGVSKFRDYELDPILFLYSGHFDPERPLENLVAGGVDFTYSLAEGVIYHVVTSGRSPGGGGWFTAGFGGEGEGRMAGCFLGDETIYDNEEPLTTQGFLDGLFCAYAVAWTPNGDEISAKAVPHRSDGTGLFYFFNEDNWELTVKILDGCKVNGHYWVFVSGTTNLEVEIRVWNWTEDFPLKIYHNPKGRAFETVADTQTFRCP